MRSFLLALGALILAAPSFAWLTLTAVPPDKVYHTPGETIKVE